MCETVTRFQESTAVLHDCSSLEVLTPQNRACFFGHGYDKKKFSISGVMTWDVNRDCDQRMTFGSGVDNLYQTGQPRASYINRLSTVLNR